ncbi:MAG: nickel-dependent lactate racemase, partial [Candidatus Omnitrophica bacterium]|nr:nickel-dependent lactate racemase [Candidatus Omnitrophota bacterium]
RPLNGVSFDDLMVGKNNILVAVPDNTRSAHLKDILPVLLRRIESKGRAITIVAATGLHKSHDGPELRSLVGKAIFKSYRVKSHTQDERSLIDFGRTSKGVPVVLNRMVRDCDLIISVGVIEPHLYAGYSGGAKTVAIGLAGKVTIDHTHGTRFLDDRSTRIASIDGNLFQDTLWEIAAKTPLGFSVNVVNDPDGTAAAVFAGSPRDVFEKGVKLAKKIFEVTVVKEGGIVICGIGYPKDINLYQSSRAINYVANVDRPVISKGGVIVVAAELRDGIGLSQAEKLFYKNLCVMRSPRQLVEEVRREGCVAGKHRAYMLAAPLMDYKVIFVTASSKKGFMRNLPFETFSSIRKAILRAEDIVGRDAGVYVIPKALATVAIRRI